MKPQWPKPWKEFFVPIYGGRVYIFQSRQKVEAARVYLGSSIKSSTENGICEHLVNKETGNSIYVVGWYDKKLTTLIHEFGHMSFFILDHAGIDARDSRGETYCYLLENLLERAGVK